MASPVDVHVLLGLRIPHWPDGARLHATDQGRTEMDDWTQCKQYHYFLVPIY
jgi:hypothetical protein